MGKIAEDRAVDLIQHLNVSLQDRIAKYKNSTLAAIKGIFITEEKEGGKFLVRSLDGPIATFSLQELPGCCGILISYWSEVVPEFRKKGIGAELVQIRMMAARAMKYGSMLATVDKKNSDEVSLLNNAHWNKVSEFRNPRTSNIIEVYIVNL